MKHSDNVELALTRTLDNTLSPNDAMADRCALAGEVGRLRSMIEQTADGVLVPDCDHLFCPKCAGEVRREYHECYCGTCPNHETGEAYPTPPLPLLYVHCCSTAEAAIKAREEETVNA